MPRRDAISEKKKERLMQEQEKLQKLMFDARSSIRRSSLNEKNKMEHENRIYPPLGANNNKTRDADAGHQTDPDDVLWPELRNEKQRTDQQAEEPVIYTEPVEEVKSNFEKTIVSEDEASDNTLPQKNSHIRIILPEENVAASITLPEEKKIAQETFTNTNPASEPIEISQEAIPVTTAYPWEQAEKSKKQTSKARSVLILFVALLAGFGGYYFFSQYSTGDEVGTKKTATPAIAVSGPQAVPDTTVAAHGDLKKLNNPVQQKANTPANTEIAKENKAAVETPAVTTKNGSSPAVAATTKDQYKVISKAYFHNAPDESTRRKAFIIHWNNAVLTPLEEKNGFIYVVFTNHLGQTSKGWLRKKDLTKLN